jgi:putative endonuclease
MGCGTLVAMSKSTVLAWSVYVLRTRRRALYTGITTDVQRRREEHAGGGRKGARSLRGQAPLTLVLEVKIGTRGEALRIEAMIKRMSKARKERLVADRPTLEQLRALLQERVEK